MTRLEIVDVVEHRPLDGRLVGCRLDDPRPGSASGVYGFEIRGWALGESSPVTAIEVEQERRPLVEFAPGEKRADIAAAHPGVPGAEVCGFRAPLGALDLRAEFEVSLTARCEDGSRAPIAEIRGKRESLPAGGPDLIQPLMVNTIGRSGSTWLVWLLSCHPGAVAFKPYARDARVATYWMGVAQGLARPQSYLAQLVPGPLEEKLWWLDRGDLQAGVAGDPQLEEWLGTDAVESVAQMCQSRIEAFYSRVAGPGETPRYFVEKFLPYQVVPDLLAEVYPGAREVILVRDFRDMLCSVIAFNEKRGYEAFGRGAVGSDAEYVETTVTNSARRLLRRLKDRGDAAYLVRYEDLIEAPETTLGGLLDHLGLDAAEGTIAETLERANSDAPDMDHHRTAGEAPASIGRWRRDLSPEIAKLCGEMLDPVLVEFGYEPTLETAPER
jgi:sulfotransferase family protein